MIRQPYFSSQEWLNEQTDSNRNSVAEDTYSVRSFAYSVYQIGIFQEEL